MLPGLDPHRTEAGVDEAGRGALAGPVVAAAVILPPGYTHPLLIDSKKLTAPQREDARVLILEVALAWGLGMMSVTEVDRQNILQAALSAMHEAIDMLDPAPQHLLVDGNRFRKHDISHTCVIKGDATYTPIAAASILAKTYRDDLMRQLHLQHPHYGWDVNKGYPTPPHRRALLQHGLSPLHRRSFRCLPQPGLFDEK